MKNMIIKFPNPAKGTPLLMTNAWSVYEEVPEHVYHEMVRKHQDNEEERGKYRYSWARGPLYGKTFKKVGDLPEFKNPGHASFMKLKILEGHSSDDTIPMLIDLLKTGTTELRYAGFDQPVQRADIRRLPKFLKFATTTNLVSKTTETGEIQTVLTLSMEAMIWGNMHMTFESEAWHNRLTKEELYQLRMIHDRTLKVVVEAVLEPSQDMELLEIVLGEPDLETVLPTIMAQKLSPFHLGPRHISITIFELEEVLTAFNFRVKTAAYEKRISPDAKRCIQTLEVETQEINYTQLNAVLTLAEAAQEWGLADDTLLEAIQAAEFHEGLDYRKSGNTWLITRCAMERRYGQI